MDVVVFGVVVAAFDVHGFAVEGNIRVVVVVVAVIVVLLLMLVSLTCVVVCHL